MGHGKPLKSRTELYLHVYVLFRSCFESASPAQPPFSHAHLPSSLGLKQLVGVGQSLSQVLAPAKAELLKLQLTMSTREMVDCIMGVTRVLTRTLIDSRADGSLPGADEFLPALILVRDLVGSEGVGVGKGEGRDGWIL